MKSRKTLKVAITSMPPFIIDSNGRYSGFEVDLWEMVAKEMGVNFEYEKYNFQELISLVKGKKADVAFASITMNEKREEVIDFSYPTFNSGLRILLSRNRKNIDLISSVKEFFNQGYKQFLKPLFYLILIIFLFGNILWLAEKNGSSIASTYFPGVLQTFWIALCAVLGSDGNFFVYQVSSWIGRLIMALGQITGIAVLGFLIGELSAFMTTKKIRLNIGGPKDLQGKTVATVQGTTSEAILKNLGAVVIPVIKLEEAYKKLKRNQVEAVVFDSPVLVYYSLNEGRNWADVVGELFDKQDYGFVLQQNSPLRKELNLAILTIKESGDYDKLYKKWFGETVV